MHWEPIAFPSSLASWAPSRSREVQTDREVLSLRDMALHIFFLTCTSPLHHPAPWDLRKLYNKNYIIKNYIMKNNQVR